MEPTPTFAGLSCPDCGAVDDPTVDDRCPDCGSVLSVSYDREESVSPESIDSSFADSSFADSSPAGPSSANSSAAGSSSPDLSSVDQRRFAPFLPYDPESIVSLGEGGTPLVSCPDLAAEIGAEVVLVKDEGRNPTGSTVDRGLSLAVTAAVDRGRSTVALPTTGHAGQSAAAYAGRAGLDSQSFVPTRSSHLTKAMINVHGGNMRVVEGRFPDAVAAYEGWVDEESGGGDGDDGDDGDGVDDCDEHAALSWATVGPASPFRREGAKLLVHELCAQLGWTAPDAIVVPTGHGIGLAGAHAAIEELLDAGLIGEAPRLVAVQPAGCAPIVRAITEADAFGAWDHPDTIAGGLEISDPARGREAVGAVSETEGTAVTVTDEAILANAVDDTAATGVELGTAGGAGVAGVRALAEDFDVGDTVVVLNPVSGSKESDVLRSELMSRGQ